MALFLVAVGSAVVLVIALLTVGRVVRATATVPRQSVFDLDEAEVFVADRLSDEARAQVSYEEVRLVLGWYLDYLTDQGVAFERDAERADPGEGAAQVLGEDADLAYVLGRSTEGELDLGDDLVVEVLGAATDYVRAIGAVGIEVSEPDEPEG